jgi:hypothetical protein
MTNLIQLRTEQNPEVINLTAYVRDDERIVYVDDKKSIVYYTQKSFAEFVEVPRQTLQYRLSSAENTGIFEPLEGRVGSGSSLAACRCYSVSQVAEYCKIYRPDLLIGGEDYLLNAKELHGIGYIQNVIKPADQAIINQSDPDKMIFAKALIAAEPLILTSKLLPGFDALGRSVGWVKPNFYKPSLTAREWVETHHPDLPLFSKTNMLRIGRAFSSGVIQNHQALATNSWTKHVNKYQEIHHQVLCTSFYNISKLELIA